MREIYKFLGSYGFFKQEEVFPILRTFSEHRTSRFVERYLELAKKRPLIYRAGTGFTDIRTFALSS
jgi:hypothetical protein